MDKPQKRVEVEQHNEQYEKDKQADLAINGIHTDPKMREANNEILIEAVHDHLQTNGLGDTLKLLNELTARTIMPVMLAQNNQEVTHKTEHGLDIVFTIDATVFATYQVQKGKKNDK